MKSIITGIPCLLILLYLSTLPGEGFEVMVFGGFASGWNVYVYNLVHGTSYLLNHLPDFARHKPFGGFMQDNLTVCGGGLRYCYALNEASEWLEVFHTPAIMHSSLITTFDWSSWTFFSSNYLPSRFFRYTVGSVPQEFREFDSEFELGFSPCSVRINHTHSIVSRGSENVFWFEEIEDSFQQWPKGKRHLEHTACGLTFNALQEEYELVIVGGTEWSTESIESRSEVYSLISSAWREGPMLTEPTTMSAYLQFQNGFLIFGGRNDLSSYSDKVLLYDLQDGWIELDVELEESTMSMGVLRVPPPYPIKL